MARRPLSLALLPLAFVVVACSGGTSAPPAATDDALPVALDIAAIGVHTDDLQMYGSTSAIAPDPCPRDPDVVTWDSSYSRPGRPGLARLIASAHGAFQRLADLGPDDLIVVTRSDGTRATFAKSAPILDTGSRATSLQLSACGVSAAVTIYAGLVP